MALSPPLRFKILRTMMNANTFYEGLADGLRVDPAWILMETKKWMVYSLPGDGVSLVVYNMPPLVTTDYRVINGKELTYYP
jgi:hypothetical protein